VSLLLAKGLDNTVQGWNEQRETELKKYVTSQKRAGRKTRKKRVETVDEAKVADVGSISAVAVVECASLPVEVLKKVS